MEAAVDWISRKDAGLDADGEANFAAWLNADPRHSAALRFLQPTWSHLNRLRHAGSGDRLRMQVAQVVARRTRLRMILGLSSLAAAAAVLAVGFFFTFEPAAAGGLPASVVVRTNRQLLPDGSSVDLNAGAELAVEFTPEFRGVRLIHGEALFHVEKDASRPFVVVAGHVAVRAVGTAFAVRLDRTTVDVLVTEGRVAVNRNPEAHPILSTEPTALPSYLDSHLETLPSGLFVEAGKRVVVPMEATSVQLPDPIRMTSIELAEALAWRGRRVEFNGTALAAAIELFNRHNALQLSVADRETGALRITGAFWADDAEAFSRAVETSLSVRVKQVGEARIMFSK
jgi:transmembrane sensor